MTALDGKELTHPSYGLVQFSRRTGGGRKLFGSSIESHMSHITLTVNRATWVRSDTGDHFRGQFGRGELIELDLSSAQFAELLTTMNIGSGVPCTLRYIAGEEQPDPPEEPSEREVVKTEFAGRMKQFCTRFRDKIDRVNLLLEAKSVGQGARDEIKAICGQVLQELERNAPFFVEMFNEASEKVVTAAKAEIEAFAMHSVVTAGVKALSGGDTQAPRLNGESE